MILQSYIYNALVSVSVVVRLQQNENLISHYYSTHQVECGSIWSKNQCDKVENGNKIF
jgi:hypothetical protein